MTCSLSPGLSSSARKTGVWVCCCNYCYWLASSRTSNDYFIFNTNYYLFPYRYDEDALWCEELLECPAELSATSEYLHVLFAKIVSLYTEIMDSPRSKFMLALAVCAMILLLIWVYAQHKWERKAFLHLLREEIGGNNRVMSEISKNIESLLVNPSSKRVLHLVSQPHSLLLLTIF